MQDLLETPKINTANLLIRDGYILINTYKKVLGKEEFIFYILLKDPEGRFNAK